MPDDKKLQPRSVLVVDSDPNVLALLTSILEGPKTSARPKIRVLRARTIEEAVEVLDRQYVPIDLVLSNRTFSGQESASLSDCARSIRPNVPVMYMSAISDDATIRLEDPSADGVGLLRAVVAAFEPAVTLTAAGAN